MHRRLLTALLVVSASLHAACIQRVSVGERAEVQVELPELPELVNVRVTPGPDSAKLTFEPMAGARDYRVYVMPESFETDASGVIVIQDGLYRCAGDRATPPTLVDEEPDIQSHAMRTLVDGQDVADYVRSLDEALVGHVYVTPGAGRVPVYALGDPTLDGDNRCYFQRWQTSRVKRYTTSESERTTLLAANWRDDGIVFYVPEQASDLTTPMHTLLVPTSTSTRLYFTAASELDTRTQQGTPDVAFHVLSEPTDDTTPLYRVFYSGSCGGSHDELAAGETRFLRARFQGDAQPQFELLWTGLTGPTRLVVEALDVGCPYQGLLAAASVPAIAPHPAYVTVDELHATVPNGEVFINGQHDANNRPRAIARSFVDVTPTAAPNYDWFQGFEPGSAPEPRAAQACPIAGGQCPSTWQEQSATFDITWDSMEPDAWHMGPVLGELWVNYTDTGAGAGGKFRLTAREPATLSEDTFLHVTMEVDAYTTARRYVQMMVSDAPVPVQFHIAEGRTLIIQTAGDWPPVYELQVCAGGASWEVGAQCPAYAFGRGADDTWQPIPEVGEQLAGAGPRTRFDVYASASRVYLFLDGAPHGCAELAPDVAPVGEVSVTFGDVLFHSAADLNVRGFHKRHLPLEASRRFDNLGFTSNVPAPVWDGRLPCSDPL